ncbi:unnamed protein product [Arabis nemorensis]|uniref:phosphoinositide phospholipase C n=1 Tax=Arabis nemorensis TaxID=586526 RepID=A0A565C7K6_9BRAS|nr:unnamed protein product [Arabis nemorensis]
MSITESYPPASRRLIKDGEGPATVEPVIIQDKDIEIPVIDLERLDKEILKEACKELLLGAVGCTELKWLLSTCRLFNIHRNLLHIDASWFSDLQGYGRALWMMHAMFKANGGCGYVKKPDFMMNRGPDVEVFDPKGKLPVKTTLKVKVYMGKGWDSGFQQTCFSTWSSPNFYTRVGITGVRCDELMKKTKKEENTWEPLWDEEFEFQLTVHELALLRVEVHDYNMREKDDFCGQTCLPVAELRQGVRSVALYDRKGQRLVAVTLLMRFQFV